MDDSDEEDYFQSNGIHGRDEDDGFTTPRPNPDPEYKPDSPSLLQGCAVVDEAPLINYGTQRENGNLITRIRTTFASSPLSSLFQSNTAIRPSQTRQNQNPLRRPAPLCNNHQHNYPSSRRQSRHRSDSTSSTWTARTSSSQQPQSPQDSITSDDLFSVSSSSTVSTAPPLTPQFGTASFSSPPPPSPPARFRGISIKEEAQSPRTTSKGKEPARPLPFDVLIADISTEPRPEEQRNEVVSEDNDEWFGLDYALDLSRRERRTSENLPTEGEHSKSRESWHALHHPPHPEDVYRVYAYERAYEYWRQWRTELDHPRAMKFLRRSQVKSEMYLEEKVLRNRIAAIEVCAPLHTYSWCVHGSPIPLQEYYGYLPEPYRQYLDRLKVLVLRCPDPYGPREGHGGLWRHKRSRSLAALRQLRPVPPV